MTAKESILRTLASASGPYGTDASFTWPELCDLVFRADPQRWGMIGYPQYPNTKAISSAVSLMCRPPRKIIPTLEQIGTGLYRLTIDGLLAGRRLQAA